MIFLTGQQIYIAENAGEPEKVLILQITAKAPFQHLDGNSVCTGAKIVCDVKFCLQVGGKSM